MSIHTQSTEIGGETYVIFAAENHPRALARAFDRWDIGHKALWGCYKWEIEKSYIINFKWFGAIRHALQGEESILVLGPAGRGGIRPATLLYLDQRIAPENLGYFVEIDSVTARASDAWTYDDATGKHYICQHNYPIDLGSRDTNAGVTRAIHGERVITRTLENTPWDFKLFGEVT